MPQILYGKSERERQRASVRRDGPAAGVPHQHGEAKVRGSLCRRLKAWQTRLLPGRPDVARGSPRLYLRAMKSPLSLVMWISGLVTSRLLVGYTAATGGPRHLWC